MTSLTDNQIAHSITPEPIQRVAEKLGLTPDQWIPYGYDKAKIKVNALEDGAPDHVGKLVLVTAISPTPAGEGKTTTAVGLADGLARLGQRTIVALREPSLGPVFGMKGGAAGGGYAQVIPMEDINLHFTGDFHAIGAANNLIAAALDNHIHQGNALDIDVRSITWKRAVDMNDRQLRQIVSGLGARTDGYPREDGFEITVASEIMAVVCLAEDMADLKERLGRMIVAYTNDGQPVQVAQLEIVGALAILLKDAILPNLVQTLEGTPAIIHGGPFANIAHGCNSVIATKTAMRLADYTVTEAGFGSDLGAEKFIDIKSRNAGIAPDAVVMVATIRALKMQGGLKKDQLEVADVEALEKGFANLERHLHNMTDIYHLPVVVALNRFPSDTDEEIERLRTLTKELGIRLVISDAHALGGEGTEALAEMVIRLCKEDSQMTFAYELDQSIQEKIEAIVQRVYGGKGVQFLPAARRQMRQLEALGFGDLPICMAKTPYSFSDDGKLLGAPSDFTVTVRNLKVSAGAGFIVALTGDIMTMPGLPKDPAACHMDITDDGEIVGLS